MAFHSVTDVGAIDLSLSLSPRLSLSLSFSLSSQDNQLEAKICQLGWKCRSLIFQKQNLKYKVDTFCHTHQASLMLLKDMGATNIVPHTHLTMASSAQTKGRERFRAASNALRMQYLYRKSSQHRMVVTSLTGSKANAG